MKLSLSTTAGLLLRLRTAWKPPGMLEPSVLRFSRNWDPVLKCFRVYTKDLARTPMLNYLLDLTYINTGAKRLAWVSFLGRRIWLTRCRQF